uniref:Uncharacterized protein n=1 Tax=Oryctolagus cuniculus TaxID=9986 RepID=A0A5F9CN22_RABIT
MNLKGEWDWKWEREEEVGLEGRYSGNNHYTSKVVLRNLYSLNKIEDKKPLKFLGNDVGFRKNKTDGEKKFYECCEGHNTMYVNFIYSDSHKFIVKREYALISGMITAMLNKPVPLWKNEATELNFRMNYPFTYINIKYIYFISKVCYTNCSTENVKFPTAPEITLELLVAVKFLEC